MKITVAENIKALMLSENLTQSALSARLGMRQSTISDWLSKKKEPSIESLWKLADYFDVSVDYLIGRKDI